MKSELLVTAYQHGAVNTFSGLVHTARHTMEAGRNRSFVMQNEVVTGDWGEVVTR